MEWEQGNTTQSSLLGLAEQDVSLPAASPARGRSPPHVLSDPNPFLRLLIRRRSRGRAAATEAASAHRASPERDSTSAAAGPSARPERPSTPGLDLGVGGASAEPPQPRAVPDPRRRPGGGVRHRPALGVLSDTADRVHLQRHHRRHVPFRALRGGHCALPLFLQAVEHRPEHRVLQQRDQHPLRPGPSGRGP